MAEKTATAGKMIALACVPLQAQILTGNIKNMLIADSTKRSNVIELGDGLILSFLLA